MSIIRMFHGYRTGIRCDDPALRRAAELWLATGVVPVAHIVADLGAECDTTGEFQAAAPRGAMPASRGHAGRSFLHW